VRKPTANSTSCARQESLSTKVIKNNGFNPVWQEELSIPFDCVGGPDGGMTNLIFVEIAVRQSRFDDDDEPIAVFCSPLGTLQSGESLIWSFSLFLLQVLNLTMQDIDIWRYAICN
jgi:hypothetical protein